MADPVIAVLGPTAAGKSDLALRLAGELGGEIINADSMQLYRGMDIGTAKLTAGRSARASRIICSTCGTCGIRQRRRISADGAGRHR